MLPYHIDADAEVTAAKLALETYRELVVNELIAFIRQEKSRIWRHQVQPYLDNAAVSKHQLLAAYRSTEIRLNKLLHDLQHRLEAAENLEVIDCQNNFIFEYSVVLAEYARYNDIQSGSRCAENKQALMSRFTNIVRVQVAARRLIQTRQMRELVAHYEQLYAARLHCGFRVLLSQPKEVDES